MSKSKSMSKNGGRGGGTASASRMCGHFDGRTRRPRSVLETRPTLNYPFLNFYDRTGSMDAPTKKNSGWLAFIFSCKAAVAAILAYLVFSLLKLPGAPWATVSAVIVIQPYLNPAWTMVWHRLVANLIGAVIGAILATLWGTSMFTLGVGVLLTGLICEFSNLQEALRPALVAVVIVTLTKEGSAWTSSLERLLAVVVGCACALFVTIIFDRFFASWLLKLKAYIPIRGDSE